MRFDTKLLPVVGLAALLGACGGKDESSATSTETTAQAEPAAPRSLREIAGDTWEPLPTEVEVNREKMLLGRSLFHDTRLSGDNTISCATCHSLSAGGAEPRATSTGIRGQIGPINSPTVLNSAFNFVQFWDGRAADLREQASGPVTNPVEMGAEWPEVLERLGKDEEYVASFQAIYGDAEITEERVVDALAEYESFLVTPSRFDQWLRGEDDALNEEEKKGLRLFVETGCTTCHNGRNLGGNSYQRMGLVHNYFEERGGRITEADLGRYNVTKDEADRHKFKVPTLRNVELTAPYFHDGSVRDLDEAVRSMGRLQLGRELSDADTSSIVAFLRSLTGEIPAEAFPPGAEGEAAPAVAPAAAVPASADPVEAAPAAAPAEAAPAPTPAE